MNRRLAHFRNFLIVAALVCGGSNLATAENSLYGSYDLDGKATIKLSGDDLPFGLGSLGLSNTFAASGWIKVQRDRLIVQIDEPIRRKEVIRLDRKIRSPKRSSYRYRRSGDTRFRGNAVEYKVALNLRRAAGKWEGRGRVETTVASGDLAGSKAIVRGKIEQR